MDGVELIKAERQRQIESEDWTPEHDDEHQTGEISRAAISYATRGFYQTYSNGKVVIDSTLGWPWDIAWFKPSPDPVRNLVKAGALIAAEIDRIQRKRAAKS